MKTVDYSSIRIWIDAVEDESTSITCISPVDRSGPWKVIITQSWDKKLLFQKIISKIDYEKLKFWYLSKFDKLTSLCKKKSRLNDEKMAKFV